MKREEFFKKMLVLGASAPFMASLLSSCGKEDLHPEFDVHFNGKIIVIGAGSAGLIAGHLLKKYGIDFQILEASSRFGGRVKKLEGFADFPIDLGAEWIHGHPSLLARMLSDPQSDGKVEVIRYEPETIYIWKDNNLLRRNIFSNFYGEYKFKSTTWYDFFDQFIVPGISPNIVYNTPVTGIDYNSDKVFVTTADNQTFEADKVLVTVPLKMLQDNYIDFQPQLPQSMQNALNKVSMPGGIKVFFEFSEKFYPDLVLDGGIGEIWDDWNGDKAFYDMAFRKDSNRNVLTLFAVGPPSNAYTGLNEQELIAKALAELDRIFDGKASPAYIKHAIQNWTNEPFIRGSYSHFDNSLSFGDVSDIVGNLNKPLDNKVFFAGEACYAEEYATVHGAGESSYHAVEQMLAG